jgi:hypothetical protein
MGGKSLLAKKIIPKIQDHKCYVEVFAGAAWMFKMPIVGLIIFMLVNCRLTPEQFGR